MHPIAIRALITWVAFVPIAVANGMMREYIYRPRVGELAAHQISTAAGSLAFAGLGSAMLWRVAGYMDYRTATTIGSGWVAATVGFEFALAQLGRGLSWPEMLGDYNLRRGRVWPLFLAVIFATPFLVLRLGCSRG